MVLARVAARRAARRAAIGIRPPKVSVWRDEVINTLRQLQAEGLSAAQIALQLNQAFEISVTRCAVIGKLHRMGLSGKKPDAAESHARPLAS
jgi:GcrA cell cycle regulator